VRPQAHSAAGFTLVELMISLLLFALLSAGAFMALSGQQKSSIVMQQSSSALSNARATLNALARQIRVAKAGMPNGRVQINDASNLGSSQTQCPNGVVPAIEVTSPTNAPDTIRILFPDGNAWGTMTASADLATQYVQVRTPSNTAPDVDQNDWMMMSTFDQAVVFRFLDTTPITGGSSPCGANEFCLHKSTTTTAPWTEVTSAVASGSMMLRARWLAYSVSTTQFGGANLPALVVSTIAPQSVAATTEPAAIGIEDLQVALGIDIDGDGQLSAENAGTADADEWIYNHPNDSLLVANACALDDLRAVRLSIVARASQQDAGARPGRPALEDRAAGSKDGYYRVVLRTVVALR